MKRYTRRALALVSAAVMVMCGGASAFADFTDPAYAYADFSRNKTDSSDTASGGDNTDTTDEDTVTDDTDNTDDGADEVTDDTETGQTTEEVDTSDGVVTKPAKEVTIYSYKSTVYAGDTFKIGCRLKPSNSDDVLTYSSSGKKVATVDSKGNVTAVAKGTAIITVKASSGVKDRFALTVKAAPVEEDTSSDDIIEDTGDNGDNSGSDSKTPASSSDKAKSIELKHSSVTIYEGDTYKIIYELAPSDCTDTVSFRSLNKAVASVSSDGVVTARGAGNTRIVCKTGSGKSIKLNVNVVSVMSQEEQDKSYEEKITKEYDTNGDLVPSMVKFAEESAGVQVGQKVLLDARIYPAGAKYTYTIESDNPSVVKVNRKGEITGIKEGNAVITLSTDNGKTDSVYVTVYGSRIAGIDVSKWNGDINWKRVKSSGKAQFAMIRASYGYEDTDPMLAKNVAGCEKYDIPYGFYHYMYARNVSEARKEAAYFLNAISDYSPEYPVVLDIEEDFYKSMPRRDVTDIVTTFMEALENSGYYAMIYSYAKFFDDNLIMDKIEKYDIWVACWGDEVKLAENYSYHYGMWQYSEVGRISGIDEYVDLNYSFKNYRDTIRKYGLNNLKR